MKLNIFHHIVDLPETESILEEQQNRIINSGILNEDCTYHMCINGNIDKFKNLQSQFQNYQIKIVHVSDNCKKWEFPTLDYLKTTIDSDSAKSYVCYLHMKGSSNPTSQHQRDWRKLMEYFCIDKYKNAIEQLDKGHDITGVNWFQESRIGPHFSGNFWWATSDYIKTLQKLSDSNNMNLHPNDGSHFRFQHESWIASGNFKVFVLFHSRVHHYNSLFPELIYKR